MRLHSVTATITVIPVRALAFTVVYSGVVGVAACGV
jgi:hypothetical protein